MWRSSIFVLFGVIALPFQSQTADAQKLVLVGPGGAREAVTELLASYERSTGHHVNATFLSGGATRQRVLQGEDFDVAIEEPPFQLILKSGHVIASSVTRLAAVPVAVAVRAGAPEPDISTAAAVKRLLLSASSITYPDAARGAGAGVSFEHTLQQLGISDQVHGKLQLAAGGGGAMQAVADGKVEIGLTYQSEMHNAGIAVVGPLPKSISTPTALEGFISAGTHDAPAARELLRYLASPSAAAIYRAQGMQPMY